jgi:hypothetical protein
MTHEFDHLYADIMCQLSYFSETFFDIINLCFAAAFGFV